MVLGLETSGLLDKLNCLCILEIKLLLEKCVAACARARVCVCVCVFIVLIHNIGSNRVPNGVIPNRTLPSDAVAPDLGCTHNQLEHEIRALLLLTTFYQKKIKVDEDIAF